MERGVTPALQSAHCVSVRSERGTTLMMTSGLAATPPLVQRLTEGLAGGNVPRKINTQSPKGGPGGRVE